MTISKPDWVVEGIDLNRPNPARIYDYLLGGHHNFAADRAVAEKLAETRPHVKVGAAYCRAFVRRAVNVITAEGVDQFLDIGSGLPTVGNVHDLVQARQPQARVVYVDVDPVVIAHSSWMLDDEPYVTIIEADARDPASILGHRETRDLLDFSQPIGLTMTSLLHFVVDDDLAYRSAATLIDALPTGSYVAISHAWLSAESRASFKEMTENYKPAASSRPRPRESIARYFDGLELLEPGLVPPQFWRPEEPDDPLLDDPDAIRVLAGVGKKP